MVRSSRAVARFTVATCQEGSGYSKSAMKRRWSERLRGRVIISLLPVQTRAKRRAAAAISSKAKHTSRTAKHASRKEKNQKDDEVNTEKGYLIEQYPVSGNLPLGYQDSGYISPEYHSDTDGKIPSPPISPSTKQIDNIRGKYMIKASQALEYYHDKHPVDRYTPVDVNLKQFMYIIDKAGYYIHMNFKAVNLETNAEKIFFAELLLPYESRTECYTVTACDIIEPESLGGLRHVYGPNDILLVGDMEDTENCYACYDDVKHPRGSSTYQAGHMGHCSKRDEDKVVPREIDADDSDVEPRSD